MKKILFFALICLFGIANAQTNLITNGSFENDFWPARQPGTSIFSKNISYADPARIAQYFNDSTEKYWPKIDDATQPKFKTETGIWYIRNTVNYAYTRGYIDELKNAPDGTKCMTIFNTKFGGASANRNPDAFSPFAYTICQLLSLDNAKKYSLSFSYMKMDSLIASIGDGNKSDNNITRFVVGVVSSTEPFVQVDHYSYYVDITIPAAGDVSWKDTTVVFDLPALIAQNSVRDFTNSAIFFGLQTQPYPDNVQSMMPGQISFDNVSLVEKIESSVNRLVDLKNIRVVERSLILSKPVNKLQVYNMTGNMIYENHNLTSGELADLFVNPGIYLIKADGVTSKVFVK